MDEIIADAKSKGKLKTVPLDWNDVGLTFWLFLNE